VAGAALSAGALVLLYANRPGELDQWKGFYDESNTGWYVYRSPDDSWVMASLVCVVAAVLTMIVRGRVRYVVLGVLLGASLYLLDDGVTFLALGFAYEDGVGKWTATVLVAAAIDVAVLVLVRPRLTPFGHPGWVPLGMLAVGAVLVAANEVIELDGTSPLDVFGAPVYLSIVIVTTLTVLALTSPSLRTREALAAAAATMQLVALYGAFGWRNSDQLGPHMAVMLPGTLLILGALAVGLQRLGSAEAADISR
jgi:hypothetical protein